MSYQKIEANSYSAEELLELLKRSHVLLKMNYCPNDQSCSVTSYAHTIDGLYVYMPSHFLAEDGLSGTDEVCVESYEEWTERFKSKETWISVYNEFYCHCEYEHDIDQIKYLLSLIKDPSSGTELYLSTDRGNFYGPLECSFMEWWLKNHEGYHTNMYFTK